MWISAPTHYKVGTLTTLASITDLVMLLSYKSVYKDDEQRDSSEKKKGKVYKQANIAVVDGKPTKTVIATLYGKKLMDYSGVQITVVPERWFPAVNRLVKW